MLFLNATTYQECVNCLTRVFSFRAHYIVISLIFRTENGLEKIASEFTTSNILIVRVQIGTKILLTVYPALSTVLYCLSIRVYYCKVRRRNDVVSIVRK